MLLKEVKRGNEETKEILMKEVDLLRQVLENDETKSFDFSTISSKKVDNLLAKSRTIVHRYDVDKVMPDLAPYAVVPFNGWREGSRDLTENQVTVPAMLYLQNLFVSRSEISFRDARNNPKLTVSHIGDGVNETFNGYLDVLAVDDEHATEDIAPGECLLCLFGVELKTTKVFLSKSRYPQAILEAIALQRLARRAVPIIVTDLVSGMRIYSSCRNELRQYYYASKPIIPLDIGVAILHRIVDEQLKEGRHALTLALALGKRDEDDNDTDFDDELRENGDEVDDGNEGEGEGAEEGRDNKDTTTGTSIPQSFSKTSLKTRAVASISQVSLVEKMTAYFSGGYGEDGTEIYLDTTSNQYQE